jgi:hypothetical protein
MAAEGNGYGNPPADAEPAGISQMAPEPPQPAEGPSPREGSPRLETALWDALVDAGPEGSRSPRRPPGEDGPGEL